MVFSCIFEDVPVQRELGLHGLGMQRDTDVHGPPTHPQGTLSEIRAQIQTPRQDHMITQREIPAKTRGRQAQKKPTSPHPFVHKSWFSVREENSILSHLILGILSWLPCGLLRIPRF
ncbi:rCG57487 [Rattus norvegicus]|uniref:RCG57487 n=1 Tax=Rattus norvegicus TaxID=10116 RepID=A6JI29_RAT|nr:rCG57487 [Rattus norvegicus]